MDTMDDTVNRGSGMVLLQLGLGRFGNRRQGNLGEMTTDADPTMLKLSKVLLDSEEVEAVRKFDYETTKWVKQRSAPSFFKEGIYQTKPIAVPKIEEFLKLRAAEREPLIAACCEVYELRQREAELRLGSQFNAADYPQLGAFQRSFRMEWRWLEIAAPSAMRGVDPELYEEQRQKAEKEWDSAREMACSLFRDACKQLVDHMVERLKPGEDGKKRIFRASSLQNLRDFIQTFPLRDVGNDQDLAVQVKRMEQLLAGVDAKKLRDSDMLRQSVINGFGEVQGELTRLVSVAPMRALNFDD